MQSLQLSTENKSGHIMLPVTDFSGELKLVFSEDVAGCVFAHVWSRVASNQLRCHKQNAEQIYLVEI